jgi:hypothetical protein
LFGPRPAACHSRPYSPGEPRYALYHASFRDFLADRIDPAEVRSRVAVAIEDLLP